MLRFILPIILIGIAFAGFFTFTNPLFKDVSSFRKDLVSYNEALTNSKALEAERDKLTQKYNTIDPENLVKLQKFLPDNVDNIRLILEIEKIAAPYGMTLKDVRYDTTNKKDITNNNGTVAQTTTTTETSQKTYGAWELEFSTQGTYTNFTNFLKDLENNLRIVDVSSIQFSSEGGAGLKTSPTSSEIYKFNFKVKTYWLKN